MSLLKSKVRDLVGQAGSVESNLGKIDAHCGNFSWIVVKAVEDRGKTEEAIVSNKGDW